MVPALYSLVVRDSKKNNELEDDFISDEIGASVSPVTSTSKTVEVIHP